MLANQRTIAQKIDVIRDQHEVTRTPQRIHATTRARDEQTLRSQGRHDPHREGHLLQLISLITMKATLHCHHRFSGQVPKQEAARVTFDGGHRKAGDALISYFRYYLYFIC